MRIVQRLLLLFSLCCPATLAQASELDGFWKHEAEPGWIQVQTSEGIATATVRRNDKFPERVGRVLLKDVVADEKPGSWKGQIYVEPMEEYRNVTIALPEAGRMVFTVKVGFFSRSVNWDRVDSLPQ